ALIRSVDGSADRGGDLSVPGGLARSASRLKQKPEMREILRHELCEVLARKIDRLAAARHGFLPDRCAPTDGSRRGGSIKFTSLGPTHFGNSTANSSCVLNDNGPTVSCWLSAPQPLCSSMVARRQLSCVRPSRFAAT